MNELEQFKLKVAAKEMSPALLKEADLKKKLSKCEEEVEIHKKRFLSVRRSMDDAETDLVAAREARRRAEEELYEHRRTQIGETSLDDDRERQIEDYRKKMPALLKSIEHEKPIPYRGISDLDTIPAWPNTKR